MPNVKIKYVGRKADGERAFKELTDIEWFPGDVHEVDAKHAEQMLRHPDVFEQVSGEKVAPADAPRLKAVAADQDEVDDEAIAREDAAKKAKAEEEAAAKAKEQPQTAEPKAQEPEQDKPARTKREPKAPSNPPKKPAKAKK